MKFHIDFTEVAAAWYNTSEITIQFRGHDNYMTIDHDGLDGPDFATVTISKEGFDQLCECIETYFNSLRE